MEQQNGPPQRSISYLCQYALLGAAFGFMFPVLATIILMIENDLSVVQAQTQTGALIWIIDSAPFFLGAFAALIGQKQDELQNLMIIREAELRNKTRRETEHLASIVRGAGVAVITTDLQGTILSWNKKAEEMFGWSAEEAIGNATKILTPGDLLHETKELLGKVKAGESISKETFRLNRKGERIPVELHLSMIKEIDGTSETVAAHIVDIAKEKEMEMQLHHSARLSSIGELAAGIGHEINNPLAIANGNVERISRILKKSGNLTQEIKDCTEKYQNASDRIVKIVSGLRLFARSEANSTEVFEINGAIDQTVTLVREIYEKSGCTLEWNAPSDEFLVFGNCSRFQQVVMNLLSNARDATENSKERIVRITSNQKGDHFIVEVSDSGSGIPQDAQEKIFNAFFTTKPAGKGTGIGLSLSSSIVKEHGGSIHFKSNAKGTTFTVTIPEYVESQAAAA